MLTLLGRRRRFCDGFSRRGFLKIGALGVGGMALPELLRAEAVLAAQASGKSIINIILYGGPSHIDMFDMKPKAPANYRGDFSPIPTNVPGVEICELFGELATVADKYSIIRSIVGMNGEHKNSQSDSGWSVHSLNTMGGRPSVGAVMSKLWGPAQVTSRGTAPTFVDLTGVTRPGFLGQVHAGYRPDGTGRANLTLNPNISLTRLDDRANLLKGLDRLRHDVDRSGMMNAVDSFTQRAVGMVTSGEIATALDIEKEDPQVVERYAIKKYGENKLMLVARRLVEAGTRYVAFTWGGWDTHSNNFPTLRSELPFLGRGLTALIEDLEARGRLDDTIIMMSGEFGRTPWVNGSAGRDHWPPAAFFFLAGGGMRHGQVIGATSPRGDRPVDRPVHLQHVFHTVYHQLGIDADSVTLIDPNGRPRYLLDHRELIPELV